MTLADYMYQEKKEEEYLSVLKTALTHQYNNFRTTYRIPEKIITTTRNNTDNMKTNSTRLSRKQK